MDKLIEESMMILRILVITVLAIMALATFVYPQDAPQPDKTIPPDLVHMDRPSCNIVEHAVAEVFDAKTRKTEQVFNYRVEPFATYDDHRDRWELPQETMAATRELHPGAIGDFTSSHEAIDACFAWMKKVKAMRAREVASIGHGSKKSVDK